MQLGLPAVLPGKLDTDAIDEGGERAVVDLQESLVDLVAAADIEIKHAILGRHIKQDGQEALFAFLEYDGDPVAALDQTFELEDDLVPIGQGAAFDFLFRVVVFPGACGSSWCVGKSLDE